MHPKRCPPIHRPAFGAFKMGDGMRVNERPWYRSMRHVVDEQRLWLESKLDINSQGYDPHISADEKRRLLDEIDFLKGLSERLIMRQMSHGWL